MDCIATLDHLREAWQEDLGVEISDNQWRKAQDNVHSSSVCIRHGLLQFKILHRLHLSELKLQNVFFSESILWKVWTRSSLYAHMLWGCPRMVNFWNKIFQSEVSQKTDAVLALFGVKPTTVHLSSNQNNMIRYVTLLARLLIF